jgi:hypothetical protein
MKRTKDYRRMRINWNHQDGFNLDIPHSGWLAFCIGVTLLLDKLPDFISAIRWW